uniref:Secreted protein n=1 Tax=Achlya hypogyna TaxID=1202772 RepID=A0A0A7CM88_ACHHY|nr:secreted protein [Achlya hypogyna]
MRASVLAIAATVAAAANNQTATTKVFSLEVGTVGVHASRNQDSVLIPCKSNVCVPTGSATLEFCRKACNRETGEHDCTTNCACNGTTPGYMCAGICNKAKTADECGSPVFQTCSGEDLVCDRTPPSPAPSPSPAPTTNAPTTNAPTTSAPTTSAPTTGAPTTSEPPTHSPTFTPSPSPAPTPTAPGPVPTTNAPPTSAPSQRVRFVKLLNPGEAHLIEYYTGLYFGPGQNNANDGFIWNPSVGSIKSISGNSCLDAYVAVDHNVYVHTYPCDDSNPNQWWLYDSSLHQLRHKTHSTMCLDADPNDANKKVQMYLCSPGNANQYFDMRPILS